MVDLMRTSNGKVGFAELFFDLVFVFAVTQVSHGLLSHYSLGGALETAFLFITIWGVWIYTTWVLNRLDPDLVFVRLLLFGMMLAGLILSMALPQAFGERGLIFAVAVVTIQVGRSVIMWATAHDTQVRLTFLRISIWFVVSAVFWVFGGFAAGEARIVLWVAALGIEYFGPLIGFWVPGLGRDVSRNWAVRGDHIAERCGLFVIICLGETLLISGATFADMSWTAAGMAAFLASFVATIGMWWVYFNVGHRRGAYQIEHSDDPGRLARLAFTYVHIPIVAGIVLSAVGAERAIAHPLHHGSVAEAASIIGGAALFLAGTGWFKAISGRYFPFSHVIGLVLCVVGIGLAPFTSLLGLAVAGAALLGIVAVWEAVSLRDVAL